jgi:aerobic C4-dicarboxylate transport protein
MLSMPAIPLTTVQKITGAMIILIKRIKASPNGVALLYFEIVSTIALLIGLVVINIAKPGVGMNVDPTRPIRSAIVETISKYNNATPPVFPTDFMLSMPAIPGVGMNVDPTTLDTSGIQKYVSSGESQSTIDFLMHIIPDMLKNTCAT